ncbi:FMRFamide peptide [Parelaphostrongylus tenuis]|uniref:FMRFamide peptide n=1 Tax=Parelaphostrongylus tenuis TaxID=148309 RepID=A0AAD5QGC0_PARTN|nr:FMRFamide peptide [Parelaphostrongylus tenuis]
MPTLLKVGLLLTIGVFAQVASECCTSGEQSNFCLVYNMLAPMEQLEVMSYLGETCDGDPDEALRLMEKRKPNIMRFGRSISFGKKGSDPNFLRFGRDRPNFFRFGKGGDNPNFLRFGRAGVDPNFLRFGKRPADPNFLRFGRKPNFLRFGK